MELKLPFSWSLVHPQRDWKLLLLSSSVIAVLIVIWSTYLFFASQENDSVEVVTVSTENTGTAKQVERISSFFEKRAPSIDPSL